MAKIEVYTTDYCPYCVRAKDLLKRKGIAFEEVMMSTQEERMAKGQAHIANIRAMFNKK